MRMPKPRMDEVSRFFLEIRRGIDALLRTKLLNRWQKPWDVLDNRITSRQPGDNQDPYGKGKVELRRRELDRIEFQVDM